jgi:hypothetical protein
LSPLFLPHNAGNPIHSLAVLRLVCAGIFTFSFPSSPSQIHFPLTHL